MVDLFIWWKSTLEARVIEEHQVDPRRATTGLRRAALVEAATLLALFCVAMPLKYFAQAPWAVSIIGPVHGLMFMVFLWFVVRSWAEGLINGAGALRLFVGALIPLGGVINERWLRRQVDGVITQ